MPLHKTYCPLSSGPQFVYDEVFNRYWKLVSVSTITKFKVSVTELSDAVNTGMAKQAEGCRLALLRKSLPSAVGLICWLAD
jgi:hypothetical protein